MLSMKCSMLLPLPGKIHRKEDTQGQIEEEDGGEGGHVSCLLDRRRATQRVSGCCTLAACAGQQQGSHHRDPDRPLQPGPEAPSPQTRAAEILEEAPPTVIRPSTLAAHMAVRGCGWAALT
eukprot:729541-Hanusia_phi.AAC.2